MIYPIYSPFIISWDRVQISRIKCEWSLAGYLIHIVKKNIQNQEDHGYFYSYQKFQKLEVKTKN